jgi:quercetin dioxygenase-like cupin family protein
LLGSTPCGLVKGKIGAKNELLESQGVLHNHPIDHCGVVIDGEIEMSVGEEKKLLRPLETYFIPAGVKHNWKTTALSAKILDIVVKQGQEN